MQALSFLPDSFEEYEDLRALLDEGARWFDTRSLASVEVRGRKFDIYMASVGSTDPRAPAVAFFGGIHGLERIGSRLVLEYMRSLISRLAWDDLLIQLLDSVRIYCCPIVNPGGMWAATRANPRGVDLMRNAPQNADARVPLLAGGQRVGAWLPWYRGRAGEPMEPEAAALLRVVETQLAARPLSFALDCHSGYGWSDSIWFPYARTRKQMPHLPEMYALKNMFEHAHPHHGYTFEPQSHQYLLHGDLWDYAYDHTPSPNVFLPMTLELGSWLWIKKNPRQLFSRQGMFNPVKAHRTARVLRRHANLLDFLAHAAFSSSRWLPRGNGRELLLQSALDHWYRPERA
ncbi:M14 family zinc carboxypeptidase [Paraburkholderia sp. ZP32-5]|uniref:M14 family zinc carboxypeptidase n=1 Tax=Paraburkholderia sp. ZP32-5 TaxID=2883245 RepID=UPI001F31FE83|nr:M14 family zinc carboxypeptidase [Paraburkholderia sp. ZP32-5]